jgi:hypothetical protein
MDQYLEYKRMEGYACDLLREAYYRTRGDFLQHLQTQGILQHHKTIGDTDVLDLSWASEMAKVFALFELHGETFSPKDWTEDDDYSCIYQIVVRVLGAGREPLPELLQGRSITLLPYNVYPLDMATESARRERGFGIWGLGPNDLDNYGMILNVTEWRFHPRTDPDGWRALGGPELIALDEDESRRGDPQQILPPEPEWLDDLLADVRERVEQRFGSIETPLR